MKNTARAFAAFVLANLYQLRHRLAPHGTSCRREARRSGEMPEQRRSSAADRARHASVQRQQRAITPTDTRHDAATSPVQSFLSSTRRLESANNADTVTLAHQHAFAPPHTRRSSSGRKRDCTNERASYRTRL